mmetsp:Transcript_38951/g.34628  ORF Transcript_38951/g.34628 Transcript_38951/m.34628 type:complete len:240 (+) Transcript_38951:69-788(+)
MADEEYDYLFKIVVVGNSSVGKTNLFTRFFKDTFLGDAKPTLGCDFSAKTIEIKGCKVRAQLWDTAGQERFRAMARTFYKGAHGCLLVYDITSQKSFEELDKWLDEVKKQGESDLVPFVMGNKCDLEDQRAVKKEEGESYAEKLGIGFNEVSAKENTNVFQSVEEICTSILKVKDPELFKEGGAKKATQEEVQQQQEIKKIVESSNSQDIETTKTSNPTPQQRTDRGNTKLSKNPPGQQ